MTTLKANFISGFDDKVAALFAPSIQEGQVFEAYLGEEACFFIQGENFSTIQGQFQLLSLNLNELILSSF